MTLGGLTMDRTDPTALPDETETRRTWAAYLRAAMTRRYGEGFKNNQLTDATGGAVRDQTVSRWLRSEVTPTLPLVRTTVKALDLNLAEALIAAGFGDLVAEIADSLVGEATRRRDEEEMRRELAAIRANIARVEEDLERRIARGHARRVTARDAEKPGTNDPES